MLEDDTERKKCVLDILANLPDYKVMEEEFSVKFRVFDKTLLKNFPLNFDFFDKNLLPIFL